MPYSLTNRINPLPTKICPRCGAERKPGPKEWPKRWNERPYCQPCAQVQDLFVRFWSKVYMTATCWLWLGAINSHGYGQMFKSKNTGKAIKYEAHRFSYESFKGPIPDDLELDHLCRVPCCINPEHLEPVTHRENMIRGVISRKANAVC